MPDIDKIELDLNKFESPTTGFLKITNRPLNVYPNPCTSYLQIDSKSPVKQVDICSMAGCYMRRYYQSGISVSDLHPGAYLLKVTTEQGSYTKQIIKE